MMAHERTPSGFRIPEGVHYLNCAFMSPLHPEVEEAGLEGMALKRRPWEVGPEHFFRESDLLRQRFAALLGDGSPEMSSVEPNRIALLPSVSYGVAIAARNAGPIRGRRIVLLRDQFPGNVYGWTALANREGGEVHLVEPPPGGLGTPGRGAGWNERILEAISPETAVVALPPVHWTDGTRFDLEAVGKRAREVGALLVLDATQTAGAYPLDLDRVRPDALISAGYKWLMGPYSMALGYFGHRFDDGVPLEEGWVTREGSEDFGALVNYRDGYQPGAIRYDVGERSNFTLVPMMVRALELLQEWGVQRVAGHAGHLNQVLASALAERGYRVEAPEWRAPHILGAGVPAGVELTAVKAALEERNVFVSIRGSALRISPHLYNGEDDVEALLDALP